MRRGGREEAARPGGSPGGRTARAQLLDGSTQPSSRHIAVHSPVTAEVVGTVPRHGPQDVASVLDRLAAAREPLPVGRRRTILREAGDVLQRRREEFAHLITLESGICIADSLREVERARRNLEVAAEESVRLHGEALRIGDGALERLALTTHEPVGVVCAITPFNRPLNQVVVKVAPAVAVGAPIVVKPSELTPLTAGAFLELMKDCGLPETSIDLVTGLPEEIGRPLVSSPLVEMVTFTGSVATGEKIAAAAGLKKMLMELGGNDPLIVLEDADLRRAASLAAAGAFASSGQSCRGVKRVIAIDSIADDLVELLVAEARNLRVGDIFDPATQVGAMISEDAAAEVERRCRDAIGDGASLRAGGRRTGPVMPPTVLDHVPADSELVVEETFGPVAPVIRVRDVHHALDVANSTRFGLQAGVVTNDIRDFMYLARGLRVGAVNLDDGPHFDSPHIPFGGVKRSGFGREGIRWTMLEMTTIKTVVLPAASADGRAP